VNVTRQRTSIAGALLAAVLVFAATACSGDDDASGASDQSTSTPTDAPTSGGTDTTAPPDTAGLTPDLGNILQRQQDAVVKVTYRLGDDTFTIAQDGNKRAVTSGSSMSIVTPERSIDCSDLDTKPVCLEVPEGVSSLVSLGLNFYDQVAQGLAAAGDAIPPIPTTQETVAGRSAVCAEGDADTLLPGLSSTLEPRPGETIRACVDSDTGFILVYETSGNADDLVATEVTKPRASDFEPPAPVQGF